MYAEWLVIYRSETIKTFWSVKLQFGGNNFKKMRFKVLILEIQGANTKRHLGLQFDAFTPITNEVMTHFVK